MAITVTEKQELRRIMERRIKKAVKRIMEANIVALTQINDEALVEIVKQLDAAQPRDKLESAKVRYEKSKEHYEKTKEKMHLLLYGKKGGYYGTTDAESVHSVIKNREDYSDLVLEKMRQHPKLAQIVALDEEKERLDEAILIATSQKNVRDLLQELADILEEQNSHLETAAQRMPVEEQN